jgi:integrase/recombinase XerD
MDDSSALPVPIVTGGNRVSTLDQLADIPEEEIWLQKQKSPRTRRAYRLDVRHFMRTLSITSPEELRQADHKAVIAWERYMREVEHAASSTIRRRLAALSSLYKHLVRHAARNPVGEVERPAINRDEGSTLAFAKAQARKLLDMPAERRHDRRLARPRDPLGRVAGRVAPRRDRRAHGRRPAPEPRL